MNKKIMSATMALIMLLSATATANAAQVETGESKASGTIKFDMGDWNHSDDICFYIYDTSTTPTSYCSKNGWGDDNLWGSKKIKGTDADADAVWAKFQEFKYDPDKADEYASKESECKALIYGNDSGTDSSSDYEEIGHAMVYMVGDVDKDRSISSSDSLSILRNSVGLEEYDVSEFALADVDDDTEITSSDALAVLRYSVDLPTDTKAGQHGRKVKYRKYKSDGRIEIICYDYPDL